MNKDSAGKSRPVERGVMPSIFWTYFFIVAFGFLGVIFALIGNTMGAALLERPAPRCISP